MINYEEVLEDLICLIETELYLGENSLELGTYYQHPLDILNRLDMGNYKLLKTQAEVEIFLDNCSKILSKRREYLEDLIIENDRKNEIEAQKYLKSLELERRDLL